MAESKIKIKTYKWSVQFKQYSKVAKQDGALHMRVQF